MLPTMPSIPITSVDSKSLSMLNGSCDGRMHGELSCDDCEACGRDDAPHDGDEHEL